VQEENFDTIALFEYHDEPLAASSRLGDKVGDLEIRRRFKEMESIVDKLLMKKQKARK
jgi:tRNA A37 methylthiotransferase MiaB